MPPRPIVLHSNNLTPPTRTPWGGTRLRDRVPFDAADPWPPDPVAGELWSVSLDPAFPSRVLAPAELAGQTLAARLAADPGAWGGPPEGPSLLLKLLDTADRLSLQVHPRDDDPALPPGTSGKPEAWIVLAAEPGAGLWLGLADGVERADVEAALTRAEAGLPDGAPDPVAPLLHFVPVSPGDAFVIAPGTVHAIGPGVTLLEPQRVRPGLEGLTYRFWDWGRRYDAAGRPDPAGAPRPLHRDRALAVTAWDAPRGAAFEATCRRSPRPLPAPPGLTREAVLTLGPIAVERLTTGDRSVTTPLATGAPAVGPAATRSAGAFTAALPVSGSVTLPAHGLTATAGRSLVIPACLGEVLLDLAPHTALYVLRESDPA